MNRPTEDDLAQFKSKSFAVQFSDTRFRCRSCGYVCRIGQVLSAPNPFDERETIDGCPECLQVEVMECVR